MQDPFTTQRWTVDLSPYNSLFWWCIKVFYIHIYLWGMLYLQGNDEQYPGQSMCTYKKCGHLVSTPSGDSLFHAWAQSSGYVAWRSIETDYRNSVLTLVSILLIHTHTQTYVWWICIIFYICGWFFQMVKNIELMILKKKFERHLRQKDFTYASYFYQHVYFRITFWWGLYLIRWLKSLLQNKRYTENVINFTLTAANKQQRLKIREVPIETWTYSFLLRRKLINHTSYSYCLRC